MNLSRDQLERFHEAMSSLAEESFDREEITNRSIRGTNAVIITLFLVGTLLAGLIFGYFAVLNRSIDATLQSMEDIQERVSELRDTMDGIASTVEDMGYNVEYLQFMSIDVSLIGDATADFANYMDLLNAQTARISHDTGYLRYHAQQIELDFDQLNRSVGNVTNSVHEATKPIRKLFPMP